MRRIIIPITIVAALTIGSCMDNSRISNQSKEEQLKIDNTLKNVRDTDSLANFVKKYHEEDNLFGEAVAYRELGKRLREASNFTRAISVHKEGLRIAERICDTMLMVNILNNLGTSHRRLGVMDEAASYHYKALSYSDKYGDPNSKSTLKNRVVSLNGIGNAMMSLGNYQTADSIFRQALEGEKKLNSELGMAINYANIGSLLEKNKQFDSAMVYYQKAMEMNMKAKSRLGISLCHTHIGQLYEKHNKLDSAIAEYKQAYAIMKDSRDLWHWLASCLALARVNIVKGELDKAWNYLEDADRTAEEIKSIRHQAQVKRLQYQWYLKKGDKGSALDSYVTCRELEDSVINEKNQSYVQNLTMQYERQQKQLEINEIENELNKKKLESAYLAFAAVTVVTILLAILVITQMRARRQLKRAKDDITEAYRQTKCALEVKTSFMKSIKHEVRTPLNGIMGFSQVLTSMMQDNDDVKQMTEIIVKQSMQLAKIIDDILETADIGSQKTNIANVKIDELLTTAVAQTKMKTKPGVEMNFTAADESREVETDANMLERAVMQVLDNAAKFTENGRIDVNTTYGKEKMTISVADTGCGIPVDKQEWVFEQFTKVDEFIPGTGMGLTLCRAIMERLGGKVYVDKSYTNGCKIQMVLPIKQP